MSCSGAQRTLAELRSIQDWIVRYQLITAKGVAEVASVGGFEKQYQVVVDPRKLQAFGIPLDRGSPTPSAPATAMSAAARSR